MKLHEILSNNSRRKRRRVGRGIAAGGGKTAGRGTKGQKARTGRGKNRPGFEGGQMPLVMRLPKKRGLGNLAPRKSDWIVLNIADLKDFEESKITKLTLIQKKIMPKGKRIKLLGTGEIDKALEIEVDAISGSAREKIEKAGGKIIIKSKIKKPNSKQIKK